MKIVLPVYVKRIIEKLSESGFPTYVVGGSTRDILMGKEPVDWDIATLAEPDEVIYTFPDKRIIKTGVKYGTVTIVEKEGIVELTTFRSEGSYSDGRHPDWVRFEKNIKTDLGRRDFTINAIAYNNEKGLIDPYGGIIDIENKLLRAVGDPKERFLEDSLRMIRAVRFYTALSFDLAPDTKKAINDLGEKIKYVSPERINVELFRILTFDKPSKGIKMLLETTLLKYLMPEIDIVSEYEKGNKDFLKFIFCILDSTPNVLHIRLATLFLKFSDSKDKNTDIGLLVNVMKRLCCPNDLIKKTSMLIRCLENFNFSADRLDIKKTMQNIGKENINDLIIFAESASLCSGNKKQIKTIADIKKIIDEILINKEPIDIADLDLDGNDIKELGINEGIIVGEILRYLMEFVLKDSKLNRKDLLIGIIKRKWSI